MSKSHGRMKRVALWAWAPLVFVVVSLPSGWAASPPVAVRIKLATLIPRGTPPYEILLEMREKWRQAPEGGVELIVYPDGTMGGEADMVRRMRVGQIQAAMLSMNGLSGIDKSINALQDMPMMFRSLEEVEYVREKMRPLLEQHLAEHGFVALCWGDMGWVRFFSKEAAAHPAQFMRMKLFTWAGDNEQLDLMKGMGFNAVPLETADILPGLQTGLINAVDTAPLYALAGQFYGPCPHMLELNYAPLGGATVITKKAWDSLPPATQQAMLKSGGEAGAEITRRSRIESDQAVEAMKKRGLIVQPATPEIAAEWHTLAEGVYPKIRGGMVPAADFDEVQRLLREYRKAVATAPGGSGGIQK